MFSYMLDFNSKGKKAVIEYTVKNVIIQMDLLTKLKERKSKMRHHEGWTKTIHNNEEPGRSQTYAIDSFLRREINNTRKEIDLIMKSRFIKKAGIVEIEKIEKEEC